MVGVSNISGILSKFGPKVMVNTSNMFVQNGAGFSYQRTAALRIPLLTVLWPLLQRRKLCPGFGNGHVRSLCGGRVRRMSYVVGCTAYMSGWTSSLSWPEEGEQMEATWNMSF